MQDLRDTQPALSLGARALPALRLAGVVRLAQVDAGVGPTSRLPGLWLGGRGVQLSRHVGHAARRRWLAGSGADRRADARFAMAVNGCVAGAVGRGRGLGLLVCGAFATRHAHRHGGRSAGQGRALRLSCVRAQRLVRPKLACRCLHLCTALKRQARLE